MKTFKQFLVEGGHALAKYGISRARAVDIMYVIGEVSEILDMSPSELRNGLLGSTRLTHLEKKKDSGDIDIAIVSDDPESIHRMMMSAVNNEGVYNAGTKVGSYAMPAGLPIGSKKVQVDLMFVSDVEWAKFVYHSAEGDGSSYPGVVRNILLFTAIVHTQTPNEDVVIRDENGRSVVRASRGVHMSTGMKRLFKMADYDDSTKTYGKTVKTVTPEQIEAHLKSIGKNVKFSKELDETNNPDDVAEYVFGQSVKAKDLMTAEDVIKQIKKLDNAKEILSTAKSELRKLKLPVPKEL